MKRITLLAASTLLLSGCEGPGSFNGFVYNAATQQPLQDVRCEVTSGREVRFTDSLGKFDVSNRTTPCQLAGKKEVIVLFSKDGYQAQTVSSNSGSDKIYLQPQ